ncbi:S8 family serine peptidase, partial [candidate division KSB1 bacterium]|nr:S8 family serine peptidase [candidate division KSB1 bacterium]
MTIQSRKVTLITLFLLLAGAPNTLFISQESYAGTNKKKTPSQKKSGSDNRFEPGVIIVKMKSQQTLAKTAHPAAIASIAKKIQANGITSIQQTFLNSHGRNAEILHNIYSLHFSPTQNPEEIAARFAADPNIEYAEPQRIHKILETPNDELYNNQTYTDAIAIEAAWDITKGEQGDVVIAIVDGGTDWQHPDLIDNIWTNEDEIAGNNIDDDGNGYIDDVHGWNYATNSNDPTGLSSQPTNRNHGTHTAGIAGARVNNGIGVAGMSWNCKIMPICVAGQNDWDLSNTYQGVVYAVENGADIISCSWGKPGTASIFEQDVIDYANANGSLVVAAAGNTNSNNDYNPYYPALYNYVISVGSTTDKDDKALHSNYGWSVDVFAPGMAVYSTLHGGNYGANDGTSMACPIVSGIAGLLKTKNPELTPSEIEEYIRQTADRVVFTDAVSNSMIAKGRINAHSVLSAEALTAVRMLEATFIDEDGSGIINDGENIELNLVFKNILQATNPMQIILRSPSLEIDIIDSVATLKPLAKGDTAHVSFTYHVASGTPDNRTIYLFTEIEGENYSEHEVMRFQVNPPTYLDHNSGTLLTSITTSGNLGYIGFADEGNGSGFTFKGQNSLFEAGLMVGISESQVSNCIRTTNGARNNDFTLAQGTNMAIDIPGVEADEHGILTLVDSLADNPIGVQIQQDSYIYYDEPFNDFMIVKYTITNLNTTAISNLYAGIFVDWDVTDTAQDFAGFSAQHNLGWVQNTQNQPTQLSGTMLLSPEAGFGYHAISNELWIYDAFTEQEKWAFLTQPTSAEVPNYIDISTVVSAGPMNIEAGASKVVAFALVAGTSELDIKNNAESAQLLWDNELFIPKDNTPP